MNKIILLTGLILFSSGIYAQTIKKVNVQNKIQNKTSVSKLFANTITTVDLQKHLYIIANGKMQGRNTASDGERLAAAYIAARFKSFGLTPGNKQSYLMPFPILYDSITAVAIEIDGKAFTVNKDFNIDMPALSINESFTNAVYLGNNVPDSSFTSFLKGKMIIVDGYDANLYAFLNNLSPILFIKSNDRISTDIKNVAMDANYLAYTKWPSSFRISQTMANAITNNQYQNLHDSSMLPHFRPVNINTNIKIRVESKFDTIHGNNVVGIIEGTDKNDEYLIITAHYDHTGVYDTLIQYGADDNGSGTVAVLELAQAFAKARAQGNGPRRNIVFMTVSGEEKGLWGSKYYTENPIFPLDKTTANLNIDMIGRIDPEYKGDSNNYVYAVGESYISSELQMLTDSINKICCSLEIDRKFNDPQTGIFARSDQWNFVRKGVPAIFYFNGFHADYHKTTDTPDKINYKLLEKRARFIFNTAWEMANRDHMMKRDIPFPIIN